MTRSEIGFYKKAGIGSIFCGISTIAVSGAWKGTNTDRIYEELGWDPLYYGRWQRRLTHFYKLITTHSPSYFSTYMNMFHNAEKSPIT